MKWNGGKKPTLSKLENVFTRFVCWASWLLWMVFDRYLSGNGCAVMVRLSGATFERIHDRMVDLILRQIRKKSEEKVDDCSLGRGWPSRVVKWGSWPRPNSNSKLLFVDLIVLFPHFGVVALHTFIWIFIFLLNFRYDWVEAVDKWASQGQSPLYWVLLIIAAVKQIALTRQETHQHN